MNSTTGTPIIDSMFNFNRKLGEDSAIFFGSPRGLHDSVVVKHPYLAQLYDSQIATNWKYNEFSLAKDREQMQHCPKSIKDLMLYNILFQWHLDSVTADQLFPLFSPFLTNSEASRLFCKNDDMEYTHALTYSEIVRQCVSDREELEVFIKDIEQVRERLIPALDYLEELKDVGHRYALGELREKEAYEAVLKGLVCWWCMERIQFAVSFAVTFAVVQQGWFHGIGNYVQKIMLDELNIHANTMKYVIKYELSTDNGKKAWENIRSDCLEIVDTFLNCEYDWAKFIVSDGRGIVGLTEEVLKRSARYEAAEVYDTLFGLTLGVVDNPTPYMAQWMNPDNTQNANQEIENGNYLLNSVVNDINEKL